MLRTPIYFHVYIILDFPITYRNDSVLCRSECACLHQTVNMVVFFVKSNENTYRKGRALLQMYRVVPITKRGNWIKKQIKLFSSQPLEVLSAPFLLNCSKSSAWF